MTLETVLVPIIIDNVDDADGVGVVTVKLNFDSTIVTVDDATVPGNFENELWGKSKINEGADARIRKVRITGNKAFSDKILLKLLESGTRKSYQFFSDKDKYSREKLVGDIDKLTSFYRDQGYLKFHRDCFLQPL